MNVTPCSEKSSCSTPRLTMQVSPFPSSLRLVADRHRHRALEHQHRLLGVLVAVALDRRPRLVDDVAEEHLVAGNRVEPHAGKMAKGSTPLNVPKGELAIRRRPRT